MSECHYKCIKIELRTPQRSVGIVVAQVGVEVEVVSN